MMKNSVFFLLCIVVLLAPASSRAQESLTPSDIAWFDEGLYVLDANGDATLIYESKTACCGLFSPNKSQIAFVENSGIVIVASDGNRLFSSEAIGENKFIILHSWLGEDWVWFSSYEILDQSGLVSKVGRLWRANIASGETELIASESDQIMITSPKLEGYALVSAGVYRENPAEIAIFSVQNSTPAAAYTFNATSSGSHFGVYPSVRWISEDQLLVAVPPADLVYSGEGLTEILRISTQGSSMIAEIPASFPPNVLFSPDGTAAAFVDGGNVGILDMENATQETIFEGRTGTTLLSWNAELIFQDVIGNTYAWDGETLRDFETTFFSYAHMDARMIAAIIPAGGGNLQLVEILPNGEQEVIVETLNSETASLVWTNQ